MPGTSRGTQRRKAEQQVEQFEERLRSAVAPLAGPPEPPEHLGTAGQATWITFMAERYATLTLAEVGIFTRYAEMHDQRAILMDALREHGSTATGSQGQRVQSPEAVALASLNVELRQIERSLGLGPSARARLAIDLLTAESALRGLNGPYGTGGPTLADLRREKEQHA